MKFLLHREAAMEHEEQVAYYEQLRPGLGRRYHAALLRAVDQACRTPHRFAVVHPPSLRKAPIQGFPLAIIYREVSGIVQVLAIAHHRREPGFWNRRS